jgi:DNA polymerase elongation subunit (family B)
MSWRNIFYDSRSQSIHLWTWDENGNRVKYTSTFEPYLYIESPSSTDAVSIFNTPLKKLTFQNQFERNKFVTESPNKRIFHNISCEQQFLLNTFSKDSDKKDLLQHPIKTYFFDIETYSPHGFPTPELAADVINLITIYNSFDSKYYTWGLKNYKNTNPNVVYKKCSSESELLHSFLNFWNDDPPDVIVGWNSSGFDIPYIMQRISNVLGEEYCNKMSPVGSVFFRENIGTNKFGKVVNKWYIRGISHIDYMEAYKSFARGDRESYSLGFIGQFELGETKINIGDNLSAIADNDWQLFVDYNIQDVKLLVDLDNKLKYIKLIRTLSYKGFISFEQSLGKVSLISGAIAHQASIDNIIIPTFKRNEEEVDYIGGYVHDPQRGISKAVVSYDANSLYPNTIITLNISPETKIGKITNIENKNITLKLSNGKSITLDLSKFKDLIAKEKISISKHNILYSQKFKGVIPKFIDKLYNERVDAKNKAHEMYKKLESVTDVDQRTAMEEEISDLDTVQYTYKILLNSIYGVFGQKYSPFYDIDHAASITLTGQAVVKQAAEIIYEFVTKEKKLNSTMEDLYKYGDTDSAYFSLDNVFRDLDINLMDDGKITQEARNIIEEIGVFLNKEITKWAQKDLKSIDSRFIFKQEAICDVAVFMEKKRYILHMIETEGMVPKKPFKYVGVEVVRSSFSESTKQLIRDVIESAILSKDRISSNKLLKNAFSKFCSMDISEVAFRSKISDMEKYERAITSDGKIGLGTPVHTKGAIYFNKMIKHFNIDAKYEKIKSGNKIKWFYPAKNTFNYNSLAFAEEFPTEFSKIFPPNYVKMFDKSIVPPVERLYECIGWEMPKITMETETDLFDLFK